MDKLRKAIAADNVVLAALEIARLFNSSVMVADYQDKISKFELLLAPAPTSSATIQTSVSVKSLQSLQQLVKRFHQELLFTSDAKQMLDSRYCLLNSVVDYRRGIPVTMGILLMQIARHQGYDLQGVNFPGHFLLRYQHSAERCYFIDPLNGECLSYRQLESLYQSVTDEDELEEELLQPATTESIVVRMLTNLKSSFLYEEQIQQALLCVDLLVQLCPDDPYERRDRGVLLHQLECHKVALEDYHYFIKSCPADPAAQLLKLQLRHIQALPVVLH